MGLSTNCWKYLVLTFNVLFAMSAVVLFGVSGYLIYRLFVYRHFIGVNAEYPAILLLMMAIITCSIAWIGWRTAKSMHQIHVIITGILIILVVVIEFSCFVWAMVVWDNVEIDIKSTIMHYFEHTLQNTDSSNVDTIRWDRLQVKFECCGVSGPSDYTSKGQVPFSCCGQGPLDAVHKPYASDCSMLYQRGCGKPLYEYARQQLLLVAMTALAASILQIDSTASTSPAAEHVFIEAQGMDGEIYTVIQNSPGRANTQQLSTAQVSYVNDHTTISNELLLVVLQNQDKIMKKLAEISVQFEEIKENRKTFVTTLGEATGSQKEKFIIEPIKNVNELEQFNNQLSNFDTFESLLQKYSILCSTSKGSGFNCAYRLLDALFSKDFLCKCSWTGGSRGSDVKIGFKAYKNVIKFFFEMVNSWDPSYTVENNEDFLKSVLRNALKRKGTKNIRKSSKKSKKTIKAKNVNLETDKTETQNNNKTNVDETQSNNKACEEEIQNNNNANPSNVKVGELKTNNQHDNCGDHLNNVENEEDEESLC